MTNFYISHGGPGSGRYPLGSGERPYQKFEGKGRKSSGGIRGYIRSRKEKKIEEQKEKIRKLEKKRTEELEKNKERILRTGTPDEVASLRGMLTSKEMDDVYKRLDFERKLSSLSNNQQESNVKKLKDIANKLETGGKLVSAGIDLWNQISSAYNATPNGREKPLTLVGKPQQEIEKARIDVKTANATLNKINVEIEKAKKELNNMK